MAKRKNAAALVILALLPSLARAAEVHWSIDGSPYSFAATVTIPKGDNLRVDPGVTARFATGVRLDIQGQISAVGTPESPIIFERSGTSGSWSGIRIHHSDPEPRSSEIRHAVIRQASTLVDVDATGTSEIIVEDCALDSWSNVAIHWDNGANNLRITGCLVGMNTPAAERNHEAVNGYRSSAILEHSVFGPRTGYTDTIDLANAKWGGPVPTVRFNTIHPGQDDGIDFDNSDGYIIGNLIFGRRPPPNGPKEADCPEYPVGGSGANGGGITGNEGSRPFVMNNIVYNCYHGIGYKNGARPTLINNTVVGCEWGIILFREGDISTPAFANGTIVNNLMWNCRVPIKLSWCDDDPKSTATVTSSIVPGGWPGTGNLDPAEPPIGLPADPANPRREDFAPLPCSTAVDAGFSGTVSQSFHSENVPDTDAVGTSRIDFASVPDRGSGPIPFTDIGAMEATGPDDCEAPPPRFARGEANGDGLLDISDGISVLLHLFAGAATDCEDALDADDDGALTITDPIRLLDLLFLAGPPLPAPFPGEGVDTTVDSLGCSRT